MKQISLKEIEKIKSVELNENDFTFEEFIAVAKFHARITLSDYLVKRIEHSRRLVEGFLEDGVAIYGVTTGFGDNVNYAITREEASLLQTNLLRSHACSVGDPLNEEEVRAIILMIILNTGWGCSGIKIDTLQLLCDILNQDLHPFAPGEGSVGYLSVEAHICLTLIGEGYFLEDGRKLPAKEFLSQRNLSPIQLGCKEGLSLISGTTSVTALALLSLFYGFTSLKHIQITGALSFEALKGTTKAFDVTIHQLKKHTSQQMVAKNMERLLKGSQICDKYRHETIQDACLLRTIPQVLGSCLHLIHESFDTIVNEMLSISDNPVILMEGEAYGKVFMTGNFDGSYVGTHCDMLSIAYANLGNFVERCTDRLVNHHISNGLPPFLAMDPGLNNGFMIPQYTQAALQSELKLLAAPASVDSITTCAGQEDPVSMAYHGAMKSLKCSKKLIQMTGILLMTSLQALEITVNSTGLKPSPMASFIFSHVRPHSSFFKEDRYLYPDMEYFIHLIHTNKITQMIEREFDVIL